MNLSLSSPVGSEVVRARTRAEGGGAVSFSLVDVTESVAAAFRNAVIRFAMSSVPALRLSKTAFMLTISFPKALNDESNTPVYMSYSNCSINWAAGLRAANASANVSSEVSKSSDSGGPSSAEVVKPTSGGSSACENPVWNIIGDVNFGNTCASSSSASSLLVSAIVELLFNK